MDVDPIVAGGAVSTAAQSLQAGRIVLLTGGGPGADLLLAASLAEATTVAPLVRHSSGYLSVAMPQQDLDRLGLPVHAGDGNAAFAVSVDAKHDVTTGISARDRACTARLLADPATTRDMLSRPGHVVPVRSTDGGVLVRPGRVEAAVDLVRIAGLRPAALAAEAVQDGGGLLDAASQERLVDELGLAVVDVDDVVAHRRRYEQGVDLTAVVPVTAVGAAVRPVVVAGTGTSAHLAIVAGDVTGADVPVFVHRECLSGILGDNRCGCRGRLIASLGVLAQHGRGVVVVLRAGPGEPSPAHDVPLPLRPADHEAARAVLERLRVDEAALDGSVAAGR